jgi:ABC-2 type transport system permease protein
MNKKLWFLTKMSLRKKIKTKWFVIANILFMLIIVGIANIDNIIKFFGGDFNEPQEILVIDNANVYDDFYNNFEIASKYVTDYVKTDITKYDGSYDEGVNLVEEDNKILLVIDNDLDNYIKAKVVTKEGLGTVTNAILNSTLSTVRSSIVLTEYNITPEMFGNINKSVEIELVTISDKNTEDDFVISTIMEILILPVFFLIMFLIQMIGAEVNEEKSTRSMEIIISNVSPKTHFMSKVIAANTFVLLQGFLLFVYGFIGLAIRLLTGAGSVVNAVSDELMPYVNKVLDTGIGETLSYMIPIILLMLILTFIAYSLLAGILASMTTNMEDFQQLQTPIMVVSLVSFYLAVAAGMFKGSLFIKIASYIPFISAMLSPTLYVLGEITFIDLIVSILLLIGTINILIKYGLRIYKVGILNYSGTNLWKRMFKAIKEK